MVGTVSFHFELRKVWLALVLLLAGMAACGWVQADQDECVQLAADRYGLDASLIQAILAVEGGSVGQAVRNSNGTADLGPMQINTVWLPTLAEHGITKQQVQHDRCINILVGSWILARQLKIARDMDGPAQRRIWWAIGSYHSRTPKLNVKYSLKVWRALRAGSSSEQD